MKVAKKILVVAVLIVAVAAIFSSCTKKTCPAYSKAPQSAEVRG